MAQALLPGTQLAQRLGIPLTHPFNLIESAVLTWFAQMEIYATVLNADRDDRLRSLSIDAMHAQPAHVVAAAADWFQLPAAHDGRATRVPEPFSLNPQPPDRTFHARHPDQEND